MFFASINRKREQALIIQNTESNVEEKVFETVSVIIPPPFLISRVKGGKHSNTNCNSKKHLQVAAKV